MTETGQRPLFLYGLFMDVPRLSAMGLSPLSHGQVFLRDYRLHICDRATLVPAKGERVFGVLVSLNEADTTSLYASPGVTDYQPEEVVVFSDDEDGGTTAVVYNLPPELVTAASNKTYAAELAAL